LLVTQASTGAGTGTTRSATVAQLGSLFPNEGVIDAVTNDFIINDGTLEAASSIARTAATLQLSSSTTQDVATAVSFQGPSDFSRTIVLSGSVANNPAYEAISGYSNISGTIANNTFGGSYLNNIGLGDRVAALGTGGGTYGLVQFVQNVIGTSVTGGRVCGNFVLNVLGPTGNTSGEYTGLSSYAIGSGGDPNGVLFAFNPVAQINSGSWGALVGAEVDFGVASGSTVQANYGWNIGLLPFHAINGTQDDICLMMDGNEGAATWEVGIGFGANLKPQGFGSNSTLVKLFKDVITGTVTIANGIDLTAGGHSTITGNAWISPGATITGAGNASFLSVGRSCGTIAAAGSTQATATVTTAQDTVVISGVGGIELKFFGIGAEQIIRNRTTATINVYPQSGSQIETAGTNVAVTLGAGQDGRYCPFSATQWYF